MTNTNKTACATNWTLLILRLAIGIAFMLHGWPKVQHLTSWMGTALPAPLQAAAAIAEFGGGLGLALGFLTPLSALGIVVTMLAAMAIVHFPAKHPFVSATGGESSELALVYLAIALHLLANGPGAFALDRILGKKGECCPVDHSCAMPQQEAPAAT